MVPAFVLDQWATLPRAVQGLTGASAFYRVAKSEGQTGSRDSGRHVDPRGCSRMALTQENSPKIFNATPGATLKQRSEAGELVGVMGSETPRMEI